MTLKREKASPEMAIHEMHNLPEISNSGNDLPRLDFSIMKNIYIPLLMSVSLYVKVCSHTEYAKLNISSEENSIKMLTLVR